MKIRAIFSDGDVFELVRTNIKKQDSIVNGIVSTGIVYNVTHSGEVVKSITCYGNIEKSAITSFKAFCDKVAYFNWLHSKKRLTYIIDTV